jgi:undecaprenyl-phosphate galactose phosphotransferase
LKTRIGYEDRDYLAGEVIRRNKSMLVESKIPWWKRGFDVIFSSFAVLITFPLMVLIAIAIKLTDGGSIFFRHSRVGYKGEVFELLKFRSMYPDAEDRLKKILEENPEAREEWNRTFKLKNDPRVTPVGKFLRKTSLDELPQFFNVLKGDMSVVGPRPVVREELDKYYKDKARYYLSVKPGVTGYWQVEGRSDVNNYEERVNMDVWYVQKQSFLLDLKIILKTVWVMLTGKGAY